MYKIGLFLGLLFGGLLQAQVATQFKVVLDAGHGGKDPGKTSAGVNEKEVALEIVKKVGEILQKDKTIKVIYTRKDDRFVELKERGAIANRAKADLFISVHCNAHHSSAYGSETYVLGLHANDKNFQVAKAENEVIYLEDNYEVKYAGYDINSPESLIGLSIMQEQFLDQSIYLAKLIQENFKRNSRRFNRGVKQAGFVVLHQTYMPSVLIETGFLTNPKEREFLTSEAGQNQLADNIVKAILSYREWIQRSSFENKILKKEPPQEQSAVTPHKKNVSKAEFRVQIASSRQKMETASYNFKGLKNIKREKEGSLYRYYWAGASLQEAQQWLSQARRKGYKDAFIVVYIEGKKLSLQDYQKEQR